MEDLEPLRAFYKFCTNPDPALKTVRDGFITHLVQRSLIRQVLRQITTTHGGSYDSDPFITKLTEEEKAKGDIIVSLLAPFQTKEYSKIEPLLSRTDIPNEVKLCLLTHKDKYNKDGTDKFVALMKQLSPELRNKVLNEVSKKKVVAITKNNDKFVALMKDIPKDKQDELLNDTTKNLGTILNHSKEFQELILNKNVPITIQELVYKNQKFFPGSAFVLTHGHALCKVYNYDITSPAVLKLSESLIVRSQHESQSAIFLAKMELELVSIQESQAESQKKEEKKEGRINVLTTAFAVDTSTFDILQDYKECYDKNKEVRDDSKVDPSHLDWRQEMLKTLEEDLEALEASDDYKAQETKWYKFHIFREFVGKLADATYRKITSNQTLAERAAIRKTRTKLRKDGRKPE